MTGSSRPRAVLGLNLSHDRAACLVVDGQIRVAIAEERLSRRKHDVPLNAHGEGLCHCPIAAIDYCLDAASLTLGDIDLVVASTAYVYNRATGARRELSASDVLAQLPNVPPDRVRVVGHHLGHAASAAWCSEFEDAAIIIIDGGGGIVGYATDGTPASFERTSFYHLRGGELQLIGRSTGGPPSYGNSIGDFYQLITKYLGFGRGEEGKLMGLAAYGCVAPDGSLMQAWEPLPQFRGAIAIDDKGCHTVSPSFQFADGYDGYPATLVEWFGPPRPVGRPDDVLDQQTAASAQWALENAMVAMAHAIHRRTGADRLCLAGGVALNCVANGRVLREGPFKELFIQPASSDDGTAIGNALLGWRALTGAPPRSTRWSAYLGEPLPSAAVHEALSQFAAQITVERPENLAADIAASIADGRIVGLCRSSSEFGPRALGHRSILCDPRRGAMRDYLNERVKHREPFRPFAPLVQEERCAEYFDLATPSPYMLLAATVLCPERIPAVTHVDGTARIQTVNREQEPFLHGLLLEFEALTGVAVVLNTSFNVAGEPIVETAHDAIRCFLGTGIDVLYLEDLRITRAEER
jgi:carbamoyltransferase